jgi:hypothetical protein
MHENPINMRPDLIAQLRRIAADTGRTLSDVIEEAVRESLARRGARKEGRGRFRLPVFRGQGGLAQGINLDDTASLIEIMEGRGVSR